MPRVKCPVDSLFTQQPPKPGYKLGKRACMFCSTSVSDNGTRMMAHIKLCKEINDDERESYISGDRGNLVFCYNKICYINPSRIFWKKIIIGDGVPLYVTTGVNGIQQ